MAYTGQMQKLGSDYFLFVLSDKEQINMQKYNVSFIKDEAHLKALFKTMIAHYKALEVAGAVDAFLGKSYSEVELGV